jgi:hypothetical protein
MALSHRGSGPAGRARDGREDLKLAFRRTVPAGESDFAVDVPRQLALDHEFSFASLHLVPGYFSEQASRYQMDQAEELQIPKFVKIGFHAYRLLDKDLYKDCVFNNSLNLTERSDWVTDFNRFFGRNKMPHLRYQAAFFDWWYSENLDDWTSAQMEEFAEKGALVYYGELFDAEAHLVSHVPDDIPELQLNRFKLPSVRHGVPAAVDEFFKTTRLRLHLAPFTTLVCSSNKQLQELGFDTEAMGARNRNNRFHISNSDSEWMHFVAGKAPAEFIKSAIKPPGPNGANLNPLFYTSFPTEPKRVVLERVEMKEWQWRKNADLAEVVQDHLNGLSFNLNLKFRLNYSEATETFTLLFPEGVKDCEFRFSSDLSERMGFPAKESILPTDRAEPALENETVPELQNRCLALSWDTGVVVCTPAIESSANALMNPENNLGQLVADGSGTLKLDQLPGPPTVFRADDLRYGSGSSATVRFRLHRFIDDNLLLPLHWPVQAYVLGALRASPLCR